MELGDFITWAFQAMALGVVGFGVVEIGKLRESVERLNVCFAQVIERTDYHGKQIEKHDERIRDLETKGGS